MLGVVNLDKPVGPTSHDMVALLRRLSGCRRIGHAGTLDPLASGVLPLLVGAATRFSEELSGGSKRYEAVVRLGAVSVSDDAEGPIRRVTAALPDRTTVEEALRSFVGTFAQRPPAYSARKQGGLVAHRAARAGAALDLPPRVITIHALELRDLSSASDDGLDAAIAVHSAAGTYVRSLARDLGERLGCGGYLRALRRTEAAGLRVEDAVTPDGLARLADAGELTGALVPVGSLLRLPSVEIGEPADRARFRHGASVPVATFTEGRHAVFADGELLGVGEVSAGVLRPVKVLERAADA